MIAASAVEQLAHFFHADLSQPSPIPLSGSRWVELPAAFRALGFREGAEIGVEEGRYSQRLCELIPELHLRSIDAWQAYSGYREHVTQEKLDGFQVEARRRLAPYRCDVVQANSLTAAGHIPDRSLDFVYIDANHSYEHVVADIAAWAPKVRSGGVLAGHDFRHIKGKAGAVFGVVEAVTGWTRAYDVSPWFVLRGDKSPSWLWVQP